MSFSSDGVKLTWTKMMRGRIGRLLLRGAEGTLSILFVISLAAPMVFPQEANAVAGTSKILSYQGRLTNTSGDPYTGTYCMRFSLYDSASGGTKVWPSGAPSSMAVSVTSGIFNVGVGDTGAGGDDLAVSNWNSSYANGFPDIDTTYLNVDVYNVAGGSCTGGSWESLAPRQRLDAVAYARVAADVYGTALRTSTTTVRIGAGSGQGTPIWLYLDWKNTPTTLGANCDTVSAVSGAVWYNSSGTRALACVNNIIVGIDNTNEITSLNITGNTAGTPAAVSTGAVSFAGGNNITLSQAGNAITISAFNQSAQTQNVHNVTLSGNTAGVMAQISSGTMNLAGGNNVTLSQNGNSVTISAFNQSVQTQNIHNVTLSGNTAGVMAQISSGVMTLAGGNNITLSQNGNAITISAGAGGGGFAGYIAAGTVTTNGLNTINFSNANGISFGLGAGANSSVLTASHNGLTTAMASNAGSNFLAATGGFSGTNISGTILSNGLQMSVAAPGGGGGGYTRNMYDNMGGRDFITNVTNITAISQRPVFTPFYLDGDILADRIALEMSRATSGSNLFTIQMALYTQVNSTQISRLASLQNTFSNTATASISGIRQFYLTGIETAGSSLTPGVYIMGAYFSAANTASMNYSIRGGQTVGPPVGIINAGANSNWTATSQLSSQYLRMFQGRYSNTATGLPSAVSANQIQGWTSAVPFYFRIQNT